MKLGNTVKPALGLVITITERFGSKLARSLE